MKLLYFLYIHLLNSNIFTLRSKRNKIGRRARGKCGVITTESMCHPQRNEMCQA